MSIESSNATNFELYLNGFLADTSLANNYFVEHIDNEILRVQLKDSSGTQLFNENVVIQLDQHNAFMFDPTQRTLELIAQSADFSIEFLLFSGNKFTFPNIVSPASKKEKATQQIREIDTTTTPNNQRIKVVTQFHQILSLVLLQYRKLYPARTNSPSLTENF